MLNVIMLCRKCHKGLLWFHNISNISYLTFHHYTINISFNTLRPRQNGRYFSDNIFNCVFLNENVWIPIKISLKCVPKGQINHIPALVQKMAWRHPGDKPLSEPMMVSLLTHICVFRPQWVKRGYMKRCPSCFGLIYIHHYTVTLF